MSGQSHRHTEDFRQQAPVPLVFLPAILKFVAPVTPIPFQLWVIKLLDTFDGYVHHGDMLYNTGRTCLAAGTSPRWRSRIGWLRTSGTSYGCYGSWAD